MSRTNKQWILKRRPHGEIRAGDLELVEKPVPSPGPGQFLARTVYLSLDPTNRIWMSDMDQYMPPVEIGDVMRGGTLGVVRQSNNPDYKVGDIVSGIAGYVIDAAIHTTLTAPIAEDAAGKGLLAAFSAVGLYSLATHPFFDAPPTTALALAPVHTTGFLHPAPASATSMPPKAW